MSLPCILLDVIDYGFKVVTSTLYCGRVSISCITAPILYKERTSQQKMHKSCARFRFRRYYVMLCEIHIVRDTPGELSQHHTRTKSTEGCLNILQLTEIRFLFRFSTRLEIFSTRVKTAGV